MASTTITFLFGLIIFLFGMSRLETGIHDANRVRLQQWLSRSTHTALSSAGSGVLLTTILQSSSMISLIVLAFASAGMIPLYNSIGIILGANLGTTFTGWLVTFIGFKLDLQQFAIPLMAIGGLTQMLYHQNKQKHALGLALFGLGLLIFGLNLMKDSVAGLPALWDISTLSGHNSLVYLIAGTLLAALVQSSSATMIIALSALYSQIISLPEAAALMIGADLGTTFTTILGSLTGNKIKKQLALAHFIFNLVVNLVAFIVLLPFLPILLALISVNDPLYGLVIFHSTFNFLGLVCFLPFLSGYSRWISKHFISSSKTKPNLNNIPIQVPEAATTALLKQTQQLFIEIVKLNLHNLHIHRKSLHTDKNSKNQLLQGPSAKQDFETCYESIKQREGDITQYAIRVQQQALNSEQAQIISTLLETTRALVYGCKTLKDIRQNIAELRNADNLNLLHIYEEQTHFHRQLYQELCTLFLNQHAITYIHEQSEKLRNANEQHYRKTNEHIFNLIRKGIIQNENTSMLFNVNREVHHAAKSLIAALDYWSAINGESIKEDL